MTLERKTGLRRETGLRPGVTPLRRVTELKAVSDRRAEEAGERPKFSTLRQTTKGLTASPQQRAKVRGLFSIVSGMGPCDPAHLWPQGRGGCEHEDCVIPITRGERMEFDAGELDLLPYLIANGCWAELAHMVEVHHVDPLAMLHRLTGERHEPESRVLFMARGIARRITEDAGDDPGAAA